MTYPGGQVADISKDMSRESSGEGERAIVCRMACGRKVQLSPINIPMQP